MSFLRENGRSTGNWRGRQMHGSRAAEVDGIVVVVVDDEGAGTEETR